MCQFFSFVTDPDGHPNERFYFDWVYRKDNLDDSGVDSHSHICHHHKLDEDKCNKYEYNPLTKEFTVDGINSSTDDRIQAEDWANKVDIKRIVEPLIIKEIVNPLLLTAPDVGDEIIALLKLWASVRASVRASVWASVGASVWDSVGDSVRDSVWDSVWAYSSSFFDIEYKHDFTPLVKLWEAGFVPSFDGTTWRLHAGKDAAIIYEADFTSRPGG